MTGALAGLRVLDLSRVLAGPSCAQLLGDLGADVVKVERPGSGDDTRGWGPPFDPATGSAAYYAAANRNKRSIAVDLADPRGVETVRALALASDVLIESFKTGDLERRGLGPAALLAGHPGLVYCSIRGFGGEGPRAEEPGYDVLAQAIGGLMSVTGGAEPTKAGVGVADLFTGMHAAVAILAALRHRDRTGEGQHVEVSLQRAQLAMLANAATDAMLTGRSPARHGNAHPHIVPYQAFGCRDGRHVVIAVGNDGQYARLREVLGLPLDPRFATNAGRVALRDELVPSIAAIVARDARDAWIARLTAAQVPCAPVNDVLEALDDPQARFDGMRIELEGVAMVACPIRASATPPTYRRRPPRIGEHTDEVLRALRGERQGGE